MNDAGGLLTDIDARDYKTVTLHVPIGVVGTSVNCKLQDSIAAGGPYVDLVPAAAITAVTSSITGAGGPQIDAKLTPGRPFLQVVLVTVGASTVAGATLYGHGPMSTSRV